MVVLFTLVRIPFMVQTYVYANSSSKKRHSFRIGSWILSGAIVFCLWNSNECLRRDEKTIAQTILYHITSWFCSPFSMDPILLCCEWLEIENQTKLLSVRLYSVWKKNKHSHPVNKTQMQSKCGENGKWRFTFPTKRYLIFVTESPLCVWTKK